MVEPWEIVYLCHTRRWILLDRQGCLRHWIFERFDTILGDNYVDKHTTSLLTLHRLFRLFPVLGDFWRPPKSTWDDLLTSIKFWFSADIIDWIVWNYENNAWAELKILIWLGMTGLIGYGTISHLPTRPALHTQPAVSYDFYCVALQAWHYNQNTRTSHCRDREAAHCQTAVTLPH